jgi:hypothetical protein
VSFAFKKNLMQVAGFQLPIGVCHCGGMHLPDGKSARSEGDDERKVG